MVFRGSNIGSTRSIAKRDSLSRLSLPSIMFLKRRRRDRRRADQIRQGLGRGEVERWQKACPGRENRDGRQCCGQRGLGRCGQPQETIGNRSEVGRVSADASRFLFVARRGQRIGSNPRRRGRNTATAVPDAGPPGSDFAPGRPRASRSRNTPAFLGRRASATGPNGAVRLRQPCWMAAAVASGRADAAFLRRQR